LIYTNPAAALVFLAAFLIWNIPEVAGTFTQRAKVSRKEASIQDRASLGIMIGLVWLGLALYFLFGGLLRTAAITWHRSALFVLGVGLIVLGAAFRWYAIRTLGVYFTRDVAVSANQTVVQAGPYRFIRHPAYSGTFLTMLGLGLAMANWASLVALLTCVLAGHLYRVKVEEQALSQAIGRPYLDYMQRTRRFIPWVW
jgi:protein-S-isoprenylcysteine O-methyltransferase Ste14